MASVATPPVTSSCPCERTCTDGYGLVLAEAAVAVALGVADAVGEALWLGVWDGDALCVEDAEEVRLLDSEPVWLGEMVSLTLAVVDADAVDDVELVPDVETDGDEVWELDCVGEELVDRLCDAVPETVCDVDCDADADAESDDVGDGDGDGESDDDGD